LFGGGHSVLNCVGLSTPVEVSSSFVLNPVEISMLSLVSVSELNGLGVKNEVIEFETI
jgi:hypothetical protein